MFNKRMDFFKEICKWCDIDEKHINTEHGFLCLSDGTIRLWTNPTDIATEKDIESGYIGHSHIWISGERLFNKLSQSDFIEKIDGREEYLIQLIGSLHNIYEEYESEISTLQEEYSEY